MGEFGDDQRGQMADVAPSRATARGVQLQNLERLLGNITSHLQATGNRHGDILRQLEDRLVYLRTTRGHLTTDDADQHLTLFEAQLTSLAIKTGAPVPPPSKPATDPQATQGTVSAPSGVSVAQSRSSAHPPAPGTAMSDSGQGGTVDRSGIGLPTPVEVSDIAAVAPAAPEPAVPAVKRAIGAPPPNKPGANRPAKDALARQSETSFEAAIAADETARRDAIEKSNPEKSDEDAIFGYHPPANAPESVSEISQLSGGAPDVKVAAPTEITQVDLVDNGLPAPVDAPSVIIAGDESGARTPSSARSFEDVAAAAATSSVASQKPAPKEPEVSEISLVDAPIAPVMPDLPDHDDTLGAEIDTAMSSELYPPVEVQSDDARTDVTTPIDMPSPPRAKVADDVPMFRSDAVRETVAVEKTISEQQHAPSADPEVLAQLATLTDKVDTVTGSVDKLSSDLQQVRSDFPDLIELSVTSAAKQAFAELPNTQEAFGDLGGRLDQIQTLIESRMTKAPGKKPKKAKKPQRDAFPEVKPLPEITPAPVSMQADDPVEPRHFEVPPSDDDRLEQTKRSMFDRLVPVGEAITRRVSERLSGSDEPEQAGTVLEPRSDDLAARVGYGTAASDQGYPDSSFDDNIYPQDSDVDHDVIEQSDQTNRNLRRSIFQSGGGSSALVVAFLALTATSSVLIWNRIAADNSQVVATLPKSGTPTSKVAKSEIKDGAEAPTATGSIASKTAATKTVTVAEVTEMSAADKRLEHTASTRPLSAVSPEAIAPSSGITDPELQNTDSGDAAVEPAALKPTSALDRLANAKTDESKLDLPPLATGPLSLRIAAANGDPAAQFEVGSRLAQGNGVARDPIAAVKWYTRAASSGHAQAQYRLAALYERGTGVAADSGRAKVWYTRAAQQGNVKAMHNLAVLYAGQSGATPNYVNAVQWFERAAEYDLADSQFNVAILYLNGLGVAKDPKEAFKWFSLAGRQGDEGAKRRLKILKSRMSKSELASARKLVADWRAKPIASVANTTVPWQAGRKSVRSVPGISIGEQAGLTVPSQAGVVVESAPKTAASIGAGEIQQVQGSLVSLGFDAGTADGKMGSKTRAAIKKFQAQNGMVPTGKVDSFLLDRIDKVKAEREAKINQL